MRERLVRHQIVLYNAVERRLDGSTVEIGKSANRGEVIVIDSATEARLESLGALAAIGQTVEDIDREDEQTLEIYQALRRNASSAGASY